MSSTISPAHPHLRTSRNVCTHTVVAAPAMVGLVALACVSLAQAAEPLNDHQLDAVTAGAAEAAQALLDFNVKHTTASGRRVAIDGAIDVEQARSIENAALLLQDSAQSNLQSLININAVQSAVNVLVNLNITIDSNVGEIRQLNLGSVPMPMPAPSGTP